MYNADGLATIHNSSFLDDPDFADAYIYAKTAIGQDYSWMWRNYIGIMLASGVRHRSLNFVECGVGEGWMTLSVLRYFSRKYKITPYFTLFDTWSGIDESIVDPGEVEYWGCSVEERKKNYRYDASDFVQTSQRILDAACHPNRVTFVRGSLPGALTSDVVSRVANKGSIGFLHIDMNNSVPEVAAMSAFYPLVASGGVVLLDDYAYRGYEYQKAKMDDYCDSVGCDRPISLPTGQGLIIKA